MGLSELLAAYEERGNGRSAVFAAGRRVSFGGGDLPEGDAAGVLDLRPGGGAAEEAGHVDGDPAGQKDPVIEDGFPQLSEGPFLQKDDEAPAQKGNGDGEQDTPEKGEKQGQEEGCSGAAGGEKEKKSRQRRRNQGQNLHQRCGQKEKLVKAKELPLPDEFSQKPWAVKTQALEDAGGPAAALLPGGGELQRGFVVEDRIWDPCDFLVPEDALGGEFQIFGQGLGVEAAYFF